MIFAATQLPETGVLVVFMDEDYGETPRLWDCIDDALEDLKNNTMANAYGVLLFDTNHPCQRF